MQRLKLSISPCPNDTFMFDAIINGRIDLDGFAFDVAYHDIEELNRALEAGAPDISKMSCALLPEITSEYRLLDSGAALGRGNGPLLVRRRGERTPLRRIAVPGLHTTANALVARLFPEIGERVPLLFSEIAAAVERGDFDAGGLEWERRTSLPLPLGGIVMRRTLGEETIGRFERLLRRSIEYAFAHPDVSRPFVKEHAQELEDDVIDKHITLFVNDFSLSLGAQGRAAMKALTGVEGM